MFSPIYVHMQTPNVNNLYAPPNICVTVRPRYYGELVVEN